jgi:hypothetical protein
VHVCGENFIYSADAIATLAFAAALPATQRPSKALYI